MKKTILIIAVTLLICNVAKAQYLADASAITPISQINLSETQESGVNSIFSVPMPESDFNVNNQFVEQQYASRKGWGIALIIIGGSTMLGGLTYWLAGDAFAKTANTLPNTMPSDFPDDPEARESQQAVADIGNTVGNGVKTIGIIGAVAGAGMVGTGIWLVSSDGSSSHGRSRGKRGGRSRRHRRYVESMPTIEPIQPDWGLSLNVGPTSAGLTFVF